MSIKKGLIINTAINLSGYVYLLLASFFSIAILLGNLGTNNFGIFVLIGSVVSLASVFDLGLSLAVVRKLSLPQTTLDERNKIWQTSFYLFLVMATVLSVASLVILLYLVNTLPIFSSVSKNELYQSSLIIAITVFINHLNIHFLNLPQSQQRFGVFNSKTFIVGTGNTIISALASFYTTSLSSLLGLQLIFHLVTFFYIIVYCLKYFPGRSFLPKYHRKESKELFAFGLKNTIGNIAGQLEVQLTKYLLGALSSAQAITIFYIPQNIVMKASGLVSQIAQAVFPFSASLLEKDRIRKLKTLIIGLEILVFAGGILAILLTKFVGQDFLQWWLKDQYIVSSTYPVLVIFSYYFLLNALTPIPSALVQGLNKPQITSFFAVLTVAMEIAIMLFLVPTQGAVGAAKAMLISASITVPIFMVIAWVLMEKEIKKLNA